MVARLVRDQKVAGSNPVTSTRKKPETERFPVLFLSLLHKTPSLTLFSCNGCATMRKGPKTGSSIGRWIWRILGARGQKVAASLYFSMYCCFALYTQCLYKKAALTSGKSIRETTRCGLFFLFSLFHGYILQQKPNHEPDPKDALSNSQP